MQTKLNQRNKYKINPTLVSSCLSSTARNGQTLLFTVSNSRTSHSSIECALMGVLFVMSRHTSLVNTLTF